MPIVDVTYAPEMPEERLMRLAQTLYESGHITYMRTDSTNLSADAVTMARDYIQKEFGPRYLPQKPNVYSSSNKSAQEAHEAIRPTDANFSPAKAKEKLGADEFKLYQLVWNRFVSCQMPPAEFDPVTYDRLTEIVASMNAAKGELATQSPLQIQLRTALIGAGSLLATQVPGAADLAPLPVNLIISNVPGPREPLYWDGA